MLNIKGNNYEVNINATEHSAMLESGYFGDVILMSSPLFSMRLKRLSDGENLHINSQSNWEKVTVIKSVISYDFCFKNPEGILEISVFVTAKVNGNGIRWSVEVVNDNLEYSCMEANYPTPKMTGEYLDYFVPLKSGVVIENATEKVSGFERIYPHWGYCMQYFAVYGRKNGIYIGIEDGKAASKRFTYETGNGKCSLMAEFFGIGASLSANSFSL